VIDWEEVFRAMSERLDGARIPSVSEIAEQNRDPYRVLVSTLISLRTKDEVTREASERLFEVAPDVDALAGLEPETIAERIYPAGFYNNKSRQLHEIARTLIEEHDGAVPDSEQQLLALPGVGRKTANLVLGLAFAIPAICVDTHVHRIPNRLGWIRTETPEESEEALKEILPKEYWIGVNGLLVQYGQEVCTPVSPKCSTCPLETRCPRRGVEKHR
jgi:endonuclease-3